MGKNRKLIDLADKFAITGDACEVSELGNGLINDTYLVKTTEGHKYVLQRINHNVFRDIPGLQHNIATITSHLRNKYIARGMNDIDRRVVSLIQHRDGKATWIEADGEFWRMISYIDRSKTLEEVNPSTAEAAGLAFGRFEADLSDLETPLIETIPDFHNMELRLCQLREAIAADPVGRAAEVSDILDKINDRAERMTAGERLVRAGRLKKRPCHCDTKVNNMLFDENSDEVLCVIDLDTVMLSTVFSDYGDFLRTGACTAPEDEPDTEKVGVDMEIFKAFTKGYIEGTRGFLTETERKMLPHAAALFPYMQAVRFLTDYINGDIYYRTRYDKHNLVRTLAQIKMLESVEAHSKEMEEYISRL